MALAERSRRTLSPKPRRRVAIRLTRRSTRSTRIAAAAIIRRMSPRFAEAHASSRLFLGVSASATGRAWVARLGARGEAVATAMAQRGLASDGLARVLAGRGVGLADIAQFLARR